MKCSQKCVCTRVYMRVISIKYESYEQWKRKKQESYFAFPTAHPGTMKARR